MFEYSPTRIQEHMLTSQSIVVVKNLASLFGFLCYYHVFDFVINRLGNNFL